MFRKFLFKLTQDWIMEEKSTKPTMSQCSCSIAWHPLDWFCANSGANEKYYLRRIHVLVYPNNFLHHPRLIEVLSCNLLTSKNRLINFSYLCETRNRLSILCEDPLAWIYNCKELTFGGAHPFLWVGFNFYFKNGSATQHFLKDALNILVASRQNILMTMKIPYFEDWNNDPHHLFDD